jgi:cytoplasmic iron level regulating protein YaaA (DUF328/UPF0246 family)
MVLTPSEAKLTQPRFMDEARALHTYVTSLALEQLQNSMHISAKLADGVQETYRSWRPSGSDSAAIETFRGDIFSGLRALEFSDADRAFAQQHLYMLSGMYGLLRPYDAVYPYRLEAGYRFPDTPYMNMYHFWGDKIARELPEDGPIVNVTSAEYDALVLPYIDATSVVTPKFLTVMPGATEPKFVAVHAKIARGAYARWLIQRGRDDADDLESFNDLGYHYDEALSTPKQPVYICRDFKGIGLSQRLV